MRCPEGFNNQLTDLSLQALQAAGRVPLQSQPDLFPQAAGVAPQFDLGFSFQTPWPFGSSVLPRSSQMTAERVFDLPRRSGDMVFDVYLEVCGDTLWVMGDRVETIRAAMTRLGPPDRIGHQFVVYRSYDPAQYERIPCGLSHNHLISPWILSIGQVLAWKGSKHSMQHNASERSYLEPATTVSGLR